jgi:Uncharacterized protein conserved in bacteria (DUF2330)
MKPIVLAGFCTFVLAVSLAALPGDVRGCGGAYRDGERVDVADETALIIWDEATKTEHFIRRATFVGSAYDFGFLVPTPSRPNLETADPELFTNLATITKPKTVYQDVEYNPIGCGGGWPMAANKDELPAGGVVVLEQKQVGGMDAVVLAFRRENKQDLKEAAWELLEWLNRNQYAVRPELHEWLIPYIRDNWVITAFKIAGQPSAEPAAAPKGATAKSEQHNDSRNMGLKSSAVLLSFKTDRPFFPYREPKDQRDTKAGKIPRLLRVFIAAKERMAGRLGDGSTTWPGNTVWADALKDSERLDLLKLSKAPGDTAPGSWWLTEFEDRSTPRQGTDEVYFGPSADRSVVARRPEVIPVYHYPWRLGFVCCGVPILMTGGLIVLLRLAWRRK